MMAIMPSGLDLLKAESLDNEMWQADLGLGLLDDEVRQVEADAFFSTFFPDLTDQGDEAGLAPCGLEAEHKQQQQPRDSIDSGSTPGCTSSSDMHHSNSSASESASTEHARQHTHNLSRFGSDNNNDLSAQAPTAVVAGSSSSWVTWGPPKQVITTATVVPATAAAGAQDVFARASASNEQDTWAPAGAQPAAAFQQGYPQQQQQQQQPVYQQMQPQQQVGQPSYQQQQPAYPQPVYQQQAQQQQPAYQQPVYQQAQQQQQQDQQMPTWPPQQQQQGQPSSAFPQHAAVGATLSPFIGQVQATMFPSLTQLLTSPTDPPMELPIRASSGSSGSRGGLAKKRSGGSTTASGSGALPPASAAPAAAAIPEKKGRKARGAKADNSANLAAKPGAGAVIKDTTKRKNAEIARLEVELQQKLALASDLQRENQELATKERLLKLQVSTGERRLFCESVEGITPHLVSLIQGFRSSYNQMIGANLVAQMPKDPKAFTVKEFMATWQSFVHEVAEIMLHPEQEDTLCGAVCERISNWCMAVCVHTPHVIHKASSINMQTGEELAPSMEFYVNLVAKLDLTEQQVGDMRSTCKLQQDILQQCTVEARELMTQLTQLVDTDISSGGVVSMQSGCGLQSRIGLLEKQEALFKQFEACQRRCNMVHTMQAFLVLALLTPKQKGRMIFNAFPSFPNLKLVMMAAAGPEMQ